MILSDGDIKKAIKDKRISITPTPDYKTQLGSCCHLPLKHRVMLQRLNYRATKAIRTHSMQDCAARLKI